MLEKKQNYAVLGFSLDPAKYGNQVYNNLKAFGQNVFAVNPKGGIYNNEKIYKSLEAITKKIDIAVFVVPPDIGIRILPQLKRLKVKQAWFQPGSESQEIIQWCEKNDIKYRQNACIMH